jgi:hypothetical protein
MCSEAMLILLGVCSYEFQSYSAYYTNSIQQLISFIVTMAARLSVY